MPLHLPKWFLAAALAACIAVVSANAQMSASNQLAVSIQTNHSQKINYIAYDSRRQLLFTASDDLVSELQTYLSRRVPELTNGQQQPTSRLENIANDWRVW